VRGGQADTCQLGLSLAEPGQRPIHLALEALLGDELRLAVAEQDEDGVEAGGN
jgi:hypothetical protein